MMQISGIDLGYRAHFRSISGFDSGYRAHFCPESLQRFIYFNQIEHLVHMEIVF